MRGESEVRARFEKWVQKRWGASTERWADSGEYKYQTTRDWWQCWQAALASQGEQQWSADAESAARAYDRQRDAGATHEQALHSVLADALAARQPVVQDAARIPSDMVDGELSVASAIDQVVEIFPSADRAALRTLAACFAHHSIYRYTAPAAAVAEGVHPDTARLDKLHAEYWGMSAFDMPTGGGDADVGWRVLEYRRAAPHERVVAEVYKDDPRAAIDSAMLASAPAPGVG